MIVLLKLKMKNEKTYNFRNKYKIIRHGNRISKHYCCTFSNTYSYIYYRYCVLQ